MGLIRKVVETRRPLVDEEISDGDRYWEASYFLQQLPTMLALDQNSSMIEMAQKALKALGKDREPSYEEIVEAKLDLMDVGWTEARIQNDCPVQCGPVLPLRYTHDRARAEMVLSFAQREP